MPSMKIASTKLTDEQRRILELAARMSDKSISAFMRDAAVLAAERAILRRVINDQAAPRAAE